MNSVDAVEAVLDCGVPWWVAEEVGLIEGSGSDRGDADDRVEGEKFLVGLDVHGAVVAWKEALCDLDVVRFPDRRQTLGFAESGTRTDYTAGGDVAGNGVLKDGGRFLRQRPVPAFSQRPRGSGRRAGRW